MVQWRAFEKNVVKAIFVGNVILTHQAILFWSLPFQKELLGYSVPLWWFFKQSCSHFTSCQFFIHILSYMGKENKRKHLIDPNYLLGMLFLWKLPKYCFFFPCVGGNPRTSHPLEKGERTLMRASGAEAKIKVLNQGWYWITLLYIWTQTGLLFSDVMVPCFGCVTMWVLSLGEAGLSAWQAGLWDHVLKTSHPLKRNTGLLGRDHWREEYVLAFSLQGTWRFSQSALREDTGVPLMGGLNGESSTSWRGAGRRSGFGR